MSSNVLSLNGILPSCQLSLSEGSQRTLHGGWGGYFLVVRICNSAHSEKLQLDSELTLDEVVTSIQPGIKHLGLFVREDVVKQTDQSPIKQLIHRGLHYQSARWTQTVCLYNTS